MLKIIERHGENTDYGKNYQIDIERDCKRIIGFCARPLQECPEDASLERDLAYAYMAVRFFKIGYEAGQNGEEVTFEELPEEE